MATFASQMVTALQAALLTGAGVVSITVDGVATTFDRAQALKELRLWERQVGRQTGSRPTASQIRMDRF